MASPKKSEKSQRSRKPVGKSSRVNSLHVTRSTLSYPDAWLIDALVGPRASSGVSVTDATAIGVATYFACIRNISEDVAKVPLIVWEVNGRNKERATWLTLYRLLHDQANPFMGAFTFRQTMTAHALAYSGAYAEIQRDARGMPAALWPLDPKCVEVRILSDGAPQYRVRVRDGAYVYLAAENVLHIHGLGLDGYTSYALTHIAKDVIGSALAEQQYASNYFSRGTTASGVLEVPEALSQQAFERLNDLFEARHSGEDGAHKPMILEAGTKWHSTSNNAEEAQMTESRAFSVVEICRLFRMPPHKVQDLSRATFSNIEHSSIEYQSDTLEPWGIRWEQESTSKLTGKRTDLKIEHLWHATLRTDHAARSAYYREMFMIGALSQNEIRERENMNPIEDGDTYYVPLNMVPSELAANGPPETNKEVQTDGDGEGAEPLVDDEENMRRIVERHARIVSQTIDAVLRLERDKWRRRSNINSVVMDHWYAGITTSMSARLENTFEAFAASLWIALRRDPSRLDAVTMFARSMAQAMASEHVAESKRAINESIDGTDIAACLMDGRGTDHATETLSHLGLELLRGEAWTC